MYRTSSFSNEKYSAKDDIIGLTELLVFNIPYLLNVLAAIS